MLENYMEEREKEKLGHSSMPIDAISGWKQMIPEIRPNKMRTGSAAAGVGGVNI